MRGIVTIRSYPQIRQGIINAAANGRLVVFVGAGVSRLVGVPDWFGFSNNVLDALHEKKHINFAIKQSLIGLKDPRKVLTIAKRIMEDKNMPWDLAKKLPINEDKLRKHGRVFKDLYSFGAIYLTTNYDELLDKCCTDESSIFYEDAELLSDKLQPGNVIHIHGSVKNELEAVVTLGDYFNRYRDGGNLKPFLSEVFENHTVLFVGYGLNEVEVLGPMMESVMGATRNQEIRHYYLTNAFIEQKQLVEYQSKYYKDMGVELIPYNISQNGYPQLVKVIKKWAEEISDVSNPKGFNEQVRLIDEVVK